MNDRMLHSSDSIVSTSSVIEPIVRDYNNSQRFIVFLSPCLYLHRPKTEIL